MSRPVVFVAAEERECRGWIARWDNVRRIKLPVHWAAAGRWQNRDMIAIANGAGSERAALALSPELPRPAAVVSIGTCGALDSSLEVGDIFVPSEIRNGTRTWPVQSLLGPTSRSGPLICVSRIAATASQKRELRSTGAMAVEMESAGVARASDRLGVPFYCVRAVSDLANEDFSNNLNDFLMA